MMRPEDVMARAMGAFGVLPGSEEVYRLWRERGIDVDYYDEHECGPLLTDANVCANISSRRAIGLKIEGAGGPPRL